MITLIAAAADDNAIGKGSNLLWHLPKDFKHFKNLTTGIVLLWGARLSRLSRSCCPNAPT